MKKDGCFAHFVFATFLFIQYIFALRNVSLNARIKNLIFFYLVDEQCKTFNFPPNNFLLPKKEANNFFTINWHNLCMRAYYKSFY